MANSINGYAHGHRKFYDFDSFDEHTRKVLEAAQTSDSQGFNRLVQYIRTNIIGADYVFESPFALTKVVYADYVASGKPLKFIEDYIVREVLPAYANTHTTTSITGLQSTLFRHEARSIIKDCINASEHDSVIFAGTGCTGAVHLLISALALGSRSKSPPIVIAGPYDHHATLLPWRELTKDVYPVGLTDDGLFSMAELEHLLQKFAGGERTVIGCMAAASNITGHVLPVDDITICLHKAGALAFWDFAMSAPYVELDMNPFSASDDQQYIYKDAMFISPHKFVGGPGTPGILAAKKKLFQNPVPANCGGGTVFYVRRENHLYLKEIEAREEGGTPDIIGSIRAGMVFQLKRAVGVANITAREIDLYRTVYEAWKDVPGLVILGSAAERLPVFSMVFRLGNKFLHHNFAAALLNDLFGIQSRGGCACAGPYAQELLGIDEPLSKRFEDILMEDSQLDRTHLRRVKEHSDKEILRPGFVRLNFAYFMSDEQVDFIIEAVKMVAANGWKLSPRYLFNPTTGEWKVRHHEQFADRKWLGAISYSEGKMTHTVTKTHAPMETDYKGVLERAKRVFATAAKSPPFVSDQRVMFADTDLLWFVLPSEGSDLMAGKLHLPLISTPVFSPKVYSMVKSSENLQDVEVVTETAAGGSAAAEETPPAAPTTSGWKKVPRQLITPIIKAIEEFAMINDGDKILICLSGGKDSLSLLHAMKQYQYIAKSKGVVFTLGAATVDPGSTAYDPRPLIAYLAKLEVPYFYEQQGIMQQAGSLEGGCDSICSFCSRMKRGRLYKCARQQGYTVLAMGQHLDDLAESFMMSTFHNGLLRTMKANYTVSEGDLRVIRPLVYVREKALRDFAESQKLPVIRENCPACFEQPKERHRIKQLLASQEIMFPDLYKSLLSSLRPLMAIGSSEMTLFKTLLDPKNMNAINSKSAYEEDLDE